MLVQWLLKSSNNTVPLYVMVITYRKKAYYGRQRACNKFHHSLCYTQYLTCKVHSSSNYLRHIRISITNLLTYCTKHHHGLLDTGQRSRPMTFTCSYLQSAKHTLPTKLSYLIPPFSSLLHWLLLPATLCHPLAWPPPHVFCQLHVFFYF